MTSGLLFKTTACFSIIDSEIQLFTLIHYSIIDHVRDSNLRRRFEKSRQNAEVVPKILKLDSELGVRGRNNRGEVKGTENQCQEHIGCRYR